MNPLNFFTQFAAACQPKGSVFGFPTWYKYLEGVESTDSTLGTDIAVCTPKITQAGDIWLVGISIIELLLRVAMLATLIFLVVGGVKYITSQGQPDQTARALHTIINALVGLVIAIVATALIAFIGRSL